MGVSSVEHIVIVGAGGLGREVLEVVRALQASGRRISCLGFFVEAGFPPDTAAKLPLFSSWAEVRASDALVVVAIGDGAARKRLAIEIEAEIGPNRFATLVHPSVTCGGSVAIASGSMIVGPASLTADVRIGQHVLINPGCTIAHDCAVGDYASLSPAVACAGRVEIGEGCFVGTGASLLPRVKLGAWATIGAGAVVVRDVKPAATAFGVPARERSC